MQLKKRAANIELIRILSMLMIVSLHFVRTGGMSASGVGLNLQFGRFVEALCYSCVDLFVLITGFFWQKSSHAISKSVKLVLQVLFFGVGTMLVGGLVFGWDTLSADIVLSSVFSLTTGRLWFIAVYIGLIFVAPYINTVIEKMTFAGHTTLCLVIVVLFSVSSTVINGGSVLIKDGGYDLIWFMSLYIIGAYLEKYNPFEKLGKSVCLLLAIGFPTLLYVWSYVAQKGHNAGLAFLHWNMSYKYASLPVVLAAVFTFEFFRKTEIKNELLSKIICRISSVCIGVYIVHMTRYAGEVLWTKIFHVDRYYSSPYMILYYIFFVASIFIVGCAVEYIRQLLFNKLNSKIGMWVEEKAIAIKDRIIDSCSKHINLPDAAE